MIVVVTTEEEKKIAKLRFKHIPVIVTGVGATNVIRKLKRYPKFIKIVSDNLSLKDYEAKISLHL